MLFARAFEKKMCSLIKAAFSVAAAGQAAWRGGGSLLHRIIVLLMAII